MITNKQNVKEIKEYLKQTNLVGNIYKHKKDKLVQINNAINNYFKTVNTSYKHYKLDNKTITVNDEQHEVIISNTSNNIRIIACAGSGKTTTIICRIKYLIDHGVLPNKIILMTFNVDAAKNMKNRLKEIFCGFKPNILIGTIDSIACRFYHNYFKKEHQVGVQEYCTELYNFLKSPFGNLITSKYEYMFIDEFQDVNRIQYNVMLEFYKSGTKIIVIGDDAQNIYKFRGSDMKYIIELDNDIKYLKTHTLSHNYRSTPEIIYLANKSIHFNTNQIPKQMISNKLSSNILPELEYFLSFYMLSNKIIGTIIKHYFKITNEASESNQTSIIITNEYIALDNICIISRNNSELKKMEECIEQHNKRNPDKKIQYISLIDDNIDTKAKIKPGHLTLTTIHKSKGLEWSMVFLIGCNDDSFPNKKDHLSMEEERRLFYVAATRAKKYLYMYFSKNAKITALTYVSRFIQEVPKTAYKYINNDPSIFGLSTFDKMFHESDIFKLIKHFREEDFEHLRNIKLLDNLNYTTAIVHTATELNQRIYEEAICGDFNDFVCRYGTRYIQKQNIPKSKIFDKYGFYVTRPCVLNNFEYMIYSKNMSFFEVTFKQIKINENPINLQEIITKYLSYIKNGNSSDKCNSFHEEEISAVKSIINKAIKISTSSNIKLKYIYFCNESMLPAEFRKKMKQSYKKYGSDDTNENVLEDIYNISLCQQIYSNRKRLLYRDNLFQLFFEGNTELLINIKSTLALLTQSLTDSLKTNKLVKNNKYDLQAEVDYLDNNVITLVRLSSTDNFNLLWLMQIIGIMSVLEYNKKNLFDPKKINKYANFEISKAKVYNPLRGIVFTIDLMDWLNHYEKSQYFIEFLDFVRARQNGKMSIPQINGEKEKEKEKDKEQEEEKEEEEEKGKEEEENNINDDTTLDINYINFIDTIINQDESYITNFIEEFSSLNPASIIAYEYKKQVIGLYYDKYYKIGDYTLLNKITKIKGYKYLIVDTETNGIPSLLGFNSYYSYKNIDKYNNARIVQLSWLVCNQDEQILEDHDYIIRPFNFKIENSNIHGITNEKALTHGLQLRHILDIFAQSIAQVNYIVCHNIIFDINVIKSELYRIGHLETILLIDKKNLICTLETANSCIKKRGHLKSSKLEELYEYFTDKEMEGAHNSKFDVIATNVVFCNLVDRGYLLLPKIETIIS